MTITHFTNRLINETSPYLQQHAHNPIDWYPWGEEAISKARQENKPILLSIGYSACHWCHVMADESFENEDIARIMNQLFINIKVDREERPDIDKIYQTAHQLLTNKAGGWPLTVFLTPHDLIPFYSGTYFPLESRYSLPSFKDVLHAVSNLYREKIQDINQQNSEFLKLLRQITSNITSTISVNLNTEPLQHALILLRQNYDTVYGGFNGPPKFPQPAKIELSLTTQPFLGLQTLSYMAKGGIYDQLEGGFYRYSVDEKWGIPHFEKMLYDNGQLLFLYSLAAKQDNNPIFSKVATKTANWILSEMQSPTGGYFSSLNADSENEEGKFYTWKKSEIENILDESEYNVIQYYYGLNNPPNFENKKYHFYLAQSIEAISEKLKIPLSEATRLLVSANNKLSAARQKRIRPSCDNKILTAWNSLVIKGLAMAGDTFNEPKYLASAESTLSFIQKNMWINQKLRASYKEGRDSSFAYLDDYAFLIDALITLLKIKWNNDYLKFATDLINILLEYYFDEETGGFFFTPKDQKDILYRPKIMADEATPSGNGVLARTLILLGHLLGENRYLVAAEKTLLAAWKNMAQFPTEHGNLLLALKDYLDPPKIVILRNEENNVQPWKDWYNRLTPHVFVIPNTEKNLPNALQLKISTGKTSAYLCQGTQCLAAIDDLEELKKL